MSKNITAIILAAGIGSRLKPLTNTKPKCLVKLLQSTLLEHQSYVLKACGVNTTYVVTGYRADQIKKRGYRTIVNKDYAITNMVATLFCARHLMDAGTDLLVSYGDIVYEKRVLNKLLCCADPVCVVVDRSWKRLWESRMTNPLDDAETMKIDDQGFIRELGKKPHGYDEVEGQYIGLIKFRSDYAAQLEGLYSNMDQQIIYDRKTFPHMYMTTFLQHLIDIDWPVRAVEVSNGWLEIDTKRDLDVYEQLATEGKLAQFYTPEII